MPLPPQLLPLPFNTYMRDFLATEIQRFRTLSPS